MRHERGHKWPFFHRHDGLHGFRLMQQKLVWVGHFPRLSLGAGSVRPFLGCLAGTTCASSERSNARSVAIMWKHFSTNGALGVTSFTNASFSC